MAKKTGMSLPKRREPMPPPHSKSAAAGYVPPRRGGKPASEDQEAMNTMAEDRKELYADYVKSQGLATSEEQQTEEVTPETPPAEGETEVPPVEETPEEKPEVSVADGEPPVEGEEPTKPKPGEEKSKTVPHEALHEEREKHKTTKVERDSLKAENAELQRQQADMLRSMRVLTEKVDALTKAPPASTTKEPPAPLADPEAEIRRLRSEQEKLSGKMETWEKQTAEQKRTVMIQDLNTRIANTGVELEKEGFKGFGYFLDQVTAEVRKQLKPDNSNAAEVDVPENWKKIFKETVYPRVKGMFAPEVKAAKVADKVALKKGAGLVGSPGTPDAKAEPEAKGWTYNEYLAWQRKQRAS